MSDFIQYFNNHGLIPRQQQIEVLSELADIWENKKYIFIDAPTGVGKTYIALAIADAMKKSYILTSSKMLQDQYQKDSNTLVDLKGRSNYICAVDSKFTVDAAPCAADKKIIARCIQDKICPYYNQKDKALAAQVMMTNYHYFLYAVHCGPLNDAGLSESPWIKRDVLIMDEAHELDNILINFAETKLCLDDLSNNYGIGRDYDRFTMNANNNFSILVQLNDDIRATLNNMKHKMENMFSTNSSIKKIAVSMAKKIKSANNEIAELDRISQRLGVYMSGRHLGDWLETPEPSTNSITLSPLTAKHLFDDYIDGMADKFIFMSATLTPKILAKELGIKLSEIGIIRVDTPFPPKKSPIIHLPVGKLGYKDIDKTLPDVVKAVEMIMELHSEEKGIIHAGNYKITKAISEGINRKCKSRLIYRDMNSVKMNNQQLLEMHESSNHSGVLLSPSMTTGIDLADDLSRFQIIVKLPFTSLGDPRIKKKSSMDSNWYRWQMWLPLLQSTGRSTRSESDHSMTFILDSSFVSFYNRDKMNLPKWFNDRLEMES